MLNLLSVAIALPVLVLFLSIADIALGHRGILPAGATTCAVGGLLPLALIQSARNLPPPSVRRNVLPLASLGVVAMIALLSAALPEAFWEEGGKWIFLLPYAFLISLLAATAGNNPLLSKVLPFSIGAALLLLLWSITCDLSVPGTFTPLTERAAGFSGNANYTALVTTMMCAAALDYERSRPLFIDLFFIALSLTIVLATLSRSGLLVLVLLLCVYAAVRLSRRRISAREIRSGALSLLGIAVLLCLLAPAFSPQLMALRDQSRFQRAMAGRQIDDGSAASRLAAAQDAIDRINQSPILGHGTGYARRMPELPHNLYLQQWVNNGAFGLVGYLSFLGINFGCFLRRRCLRGAMLIFVAAMGSFFSHNVLDQRPFLLLYGLLLGLSSLSREHSPKRQVGR